MSASGSVVPICLIFAGQLFAVGAQGTFGGPAFGAPRLGNCPESGPWPALLQEVTRGADAFKTGQFALAKEILANAAESVTQDVQLAFSCSLGISALFRALAFAYCTDGRLYGQAMRRANQIGLRFLHIAMNWLTHTFVSTGHDQPLIDGSMWPIGIQEINEDLTSISSALRETGPLGHAPTAVGYRLPPDYRDPKLRIAIVSLCAYPPDNPLPKYAMSNQGIYAERHGYTYIVERELVQSNRPPAWGKIKLVEREVQSDRFDWIVWTDCDTYFMNMTITLDSVLYTYAGRTALEDENDVELDPDVHMIVNEDSAMLNTGIFFVRSSAWVLDFLGRVWGAEDSPWIHHPWWEQASIGWEFLKDNPRKFLSEDHFDWAEGDDDLVGVYPAEVRVAPQSHFNSYHPITSRFLHDTWEDGKFVIAFNGVLSGSSPTVVRVLYGTYYQTACRLNDIESQCVPIDPVFPWDAH